jgi:polyribonucleotide nucleotidyltransferase
MSELQKVNFSQGRSTYTIETGKYAGQADGAVTVTVGETQVLVTAVASETARKDIDFFPLLVDFEERMYAVGRIPGSFFRREGRPSEEAILSARLVDRALRPNFPEDLRNDVHIVATILAVDLKHPADVAAVNGASAALMISGIPFFGPVGAVRMALVDGEWVPSATYEDIDASTFEIVVAGKEVDGDIQIVMVEASAPQNAFRYIEQGHPGADEARVREGLEAAKPHIAASIEAQASLREKVGKKEKKVELIPPYSPETFGAVEQRYLERVRNIVSIAEKSARNEAERQLTEDAVAELGEELGEAVAEVPRALRALLKREVRRRILDEGVRIDGRRPDEIRPIFCEVGVVPRAHGSGLFQRGETQVLTIATLGMLHLVQQLDTLSPEETKRYMHHYYFPPFSTGEAAPIRGPRRREIGHGALAERALLPVIPPQEELPYALRLVSEVLSSNGSTSMASVCASTLSLLDAGIAIKAPVGGIAMGLVYEQGKHVTLTDILGAEDAFGDMDFKVAGTRDVITALQLDTKIGAIPVDILASALEQARKARLVVLDKMADVMPGPRAELSEHAPRVITLTIPTDKIGDVIGPKGKVITEIQNATGTEVTVENDGTVYVGSTNLKAAEEAVRIIESIVYPPAPELGKRYRGVVVSTTKFGAFVNFLPGRDGLVHISKLGRGKRIARVEDVVSVGDRLDVVVAEIDEQGRVSLDPVFEDESAPSEAPEAEEKVGGDAGPSAPSVSEATAVGGTTAQGEAVVSGTMPQPELAGSASQPSESGSAGERAQVSEAVSEPSKQKGAVQEGAVGEGEAGGVPERFEDGATGQASVATEEEGLQVAAGDRASLPAKAAEGLVSGPPPAEIPGETSRPEHRGGASRRREFADFESYFDRISEEIWGDLGPAPKPTQQTRVSEQERGTKRRGQPRKTSRQASSSGVGRQPAGRRKPTQDRRRRQGYGRPAR